MSDLPPNSPRPVPSGDGGSEPSGGQAGGGAAHRRRRGSRGGRSRTGGQRSGRGPGDAETGNGKPSQLPEELPDRPIEGRIQSPEVAAQALVSKPRIGDSRPSPTSMGG